VRLSASTNKEIAKAVANLSYCPTLNVTGITGRNDKGEITGVVLFDSWTVNAVHMHIWTSTPMALRDKDAIKEVFDYVKRNGRMLAIGVTRSDNTACLNFQHALGFVERYRIRDGWAEGVDMVISEKRLDEADAES
jgi:hypothetical protein